MCFLICAVRIRAIVRMATRVSCVRRIGMSAGRRHVSMVPRASTGWLNTNVRAPLVLRDLDVRKTSMNVSAHPVNTEAVAEMESTAMSASVLLDGKGSIVR